MSLCMAELERILNDLNVTASPTAVSLLGGYVQEIIRVNQKMNLTGSSDDVSFVQGPLFDALTLRSVLHPEGGLLDVGSGGGLPGIPMTILCPELQVVLCEPRSRRAAFLDHVTRVLDLNVTVVRTQDRELPPRAMDAAVAQAVFPVDKWMHRGMRLIRDGGFLYTLTRQPVEVGRIPRNVSLDALFHCLRPLDSAPRFACRFRIHHPCPLNG